MQTLEEGAINIVSEGTRIEGKVVFESVSRVHGVLSGEVVSAPGSTLILSETAMVEGDIDADTLVIDGFVRGNISARTRVVLSRTGRVVGNIRTRALTIEFGAYFEGKCTMEGSEAPGPRAQPAATGAPAPSRA